LETLNRVIARSSDRAMANRFVCDRAIARWIDHAIARWIDHRSRDGSITNHAIARWKGSIVE
jgi:hypothetical protein